MAEHRSDPFVKSARETGFVARSAYKLLEIDEKFHIFQGVHSVLDLGAAPGGWSQVASSRMGHGVIIAVDLLPMAAQEGVECLQGDFRDPEIWSKVEQKLKFQTFDLVISDLSPNISGIRAKDQAESVNLIEDAWESARPLLRKGGDFCIKVFEGEGISEYRRELRTHFQAVHNFKPKSSRPRSRELYLVAKGHHPHSRESDG